MLKFFVGSVILASTLFFSLAFPASRAALYFSAKDGVLYLYNNEGRNVGRFANVLVNNATMSSSVESSIAGNPIIRITTDGSRDKYDVAIPIIEVDGVAYTNCAYKSVFDSSDENRSVGVWCSLTPLYRFDPEAAINKEYLIEFQTGFGWLTKIKSKYCGNPLGIEYGGYHIALCAEQAYPAPSQETTIVFGSNGQKILSIRGYELVPGGNSEGEFAIIGTSGERTIFHVNNLDCMVSEKVFDKKSFGRGIIGRYGIQYSVSKIDNCVYGSYSYDSKTDPMDLLGISYENFVHLLGMNSNKEVTSLFDIDKNIVNFNAEWTSAPLGKVHPVK